MIDSMMQKKYPVYKSNKKKIMQFWIKNNEFQKSNLVKNNKNPRHFQTHDLQCTSLITTEL